MQREDQKYLGSERAFVTHFRRLKKLADKDEARVLEFLQAAEANPDLWMGLGTTFDIALKRSLGYSATRYRRWQQMCKTIKKPNRNTIGVDAVIALSRVPTDKQEDALVEMYEVAKKQGSPLLKTHAESIGRRYRPAPKPKKSALAEENAKLKAKVAKLKVEVAELEAALVKLQTENQQLRTESKQLKRHRNSGSRSARAQAASA